MSEVDAVIFYAPKLGQEFGNDVVLRAGAVVIPFVKCSIPRFQPPQPPGRVISDPNGIGGGDQERHRIEGGDSLTDKIVHAGICFSLTADDYVGFGNIDDVIDKLIDDAGIGAPFKDDCFDFFPFGYVADGFFRRVCGIVCMGKRETFFLRSEVTGKRRIFIFSGWR